MKRKGKSEEGMWVKEWTWARENVKLGRGNEKALKGS